jgi:spermidine/putrescine transport system ATP-binding protein
VPHDQDDELIVSDSIAVMRDGRVIQAGTPEEVYDLPETQFVAEFLGAANLLSGHVKEGGIETDIGFLKLEKSPAWNEGTVAIRPEWIRIRDHQPEVNGIQARIKEVIYRGTDFDLWLDPGPIRVRTNTYKQFKTGDTIWLELAPDELVVLNE